VDDLDLVAVGIGQAHAFAASGLVDGLDGRRALDPRQPVQILEARGVNGDPDITGLAQFGHVEVVRRIGSTHVEGGLRPIGPHHAEISEESLFLVEVGRAQPPISEIEGFDYRHGSLLWSACRKILGHFTHPGDPWYAPASCDAIDDTPAWR
jgi:hypothetical protein